MHSSLSSKVLEYQETPGIPWIGCLVLLFLQICAFIPFGFVDSIYTMSAGDHLTGKVVSLAPHTGEIVFSTLYTSQKNERQYPTISYTIDNVGYETESIVHTDSKVNDIVHIRHAKSIHSNKYIVMLSDDFRYWMTSYVGFFLFVYLICWWLATELYEKIYKNRLIDKIKNGHSDIYTYSTKIIDIEVSELTTYELDGDRQKRVNPYYTIFISFVDQSGVDREYTFRLLEKALPESLITSRNHANEYTIVYDFVLKYIQVDQPITVSQDTTNPSYIYIDDCFEYVNEMNNNDAQKVRDAKDNKQRYMILAIMILICFLIFKFA